MMKTRPCALCGRRARMNFVTASDLCERCYEYTGWENTHSDEGHDGFVSTDHTDNCPICQGVPAPWTTDEEPDMPKTATARKTRTNPTTRHMSHASCSHPRTPAGRALCRKTLRSTAIEAPVEHLHIQAKGSKLIHFATKERTSLCASKLNVDTAQVFALTAPSATCKHCVRLASSQGS